ncbi:hypothetical protein FGADI_7191 [Fusarium gaditjirri]|uniref:Uncharacterized protein n=1 Tax=Fusarium gaditjirri TaxID=282569 RepID=A0A8H4T5R2_9HYPO|nr:hypothetical protein FGADI_7191 [Fusarium gaditjirri]
MVIAFDTARFTLHDLRNDTPSEKKIHTNQWMRSLPALEAAIQIVVRKQWTYLHDYQANRDRVRTTRDGKRLASDLVILDNEFSPFSQQPFELAIVDRVYGGALSNILVKHPEESRFPTPIRERWATEWRRKSTRRLVVQPGERACMQLRLSFREFGVSKEPAFLVYHQLKTDLSISRNFRATGGYSDILPINDKCIPLLKLLRSQQLPAPSGV